MKKECSSFSAHVNNDVPDGHDGHHVVIDERSICFSVLFSRFKNRDSLY